MATLSLMKIFFWDINANRWSLAGCYGFERFNGTLIQYCSHMTTFAVLFNLNADLQFSSDDQHKLEIISRVGCILSISSAFTMIAIFVWFRLYNKKHAIHINLAVAIICQK